MPQAHYLSQNAALGAPAPLPHTASLAAGDHAPSRADLELGPAVCRVSGAALLGGPALRDAALRAGTVAALRKTQRVRGSGLVARPYAAVMGPCAVTGAGALGSGRIACK